MLIKEKLDEMEAQLENSPHKLLAWLDQPTEVSTIMVCKVTKKLQSTAI
jgi:hypothetical protein